MPTQTNLTQGSGATEGLISPRFGATGARSARPGFGAARVRSVDRTRSPQGPAGSSAQRNSVQSAKTGIAHHRQFAKGIALEVGPEEEIAAARSLYDKFTMKDMGPATSIRNIEVIHPRPPPHRGAT